MNSRICLTDCPSSYSLLASRAIATQIPQVNPILSIRTNPWGVISSMKQSQVLM